MSQHKLELVPQSIADGWQALCKCGWRDFKSFYDYQDRDDLLNALYVSYAGHLTDAKD